MNEKKTNLKIHIFGDEYSLLSDESHEHIKQAALLVDDCMQDIVQKSSISSEKKIAVLGALRLASKMMHLESLIQEHAKKEQDLIHGIDRVLIS